MAQSYDLPERRYGSDPDRFYLRQREIFGPEALDDYLRCIRAPGTIHAMCEDYRAGATFDRALDDADLGHRRITCPLLALWAEHDDIGKLFDVLAIWRDWADDVRGHAINTGHYLPEEAPDEMLADLVPFLLAAPPTTG